MIDYDDPKLQEDIEKVNESRESFSASFHDFRIHADTHRNNYDFAMLSAMTFGTKALFDLAPGSEYGADHKFIVLAAFKRDEVRLAGIEVPCFRLTPVAEGLLEKMGLKRTDWVQSSELAQRLEKVIASEELSEKLSAQLKQKPQRTATMKI